MEQDIIRNNESETINDVKVKSLLSLEKEELNLVKPYSWLTLLQNNQ